ncbi:MAG: hypothetical protein LBK98_06120 [Peptococcaceae bacterium]|jgi:hypothetical protein|nr:hypothetical protein [Peptococcaceae bacterium]
MIDFKNVQNAYQIKRPITGVNFAPAKREGEAAPAEAAADVVQISAEAALRGKLSLFFAGVGGDIASVAAERLAALKEKYAGDACPVSGAEIAAAAFDRQEA